MLMEELVDSGTQETMTVSTTRSVFYFPFPFTCMQMDTHYRTRGGNLPWYAFIWSQESLHLVVADLSCPSRCLMPRLGESEHLFSDCI
jgi:hypothetical protein